MSEKKETSVREEELLPLLSPEGMTPTVYKMLLAGILAWTKQNADIVSNLAKDDAKYDEHVLLLKQTYERYAAWVMTLNTFAQAKAQSVRSSHRAGWYVLALECYRITNKLERYKRRFTIKEKPHGSVQKGK